MEVYINGLARPEAEKSFTNTWSHASTEISNGVVHAGHRFLAGCSERGFGHHNLDEIIIWEERIPAGDAYRLYTTYIIIEFINGKIISYL